MFYKEKSGNLVPTTFSTRRRRLYLQICHAAEQAAEELDCDVLRVLRVDVPLHHADHHLLRVEMAFSDRGFESRRVNEY
jgi:hypothetical protein